MEVCTFSVVSDFVAKIQHPMFHNLRLEEFTILLVDDFKGSDSRYKLLLCHTRFLRKYPLHTEKYRLEVSNLFVSMSKRKKQVSQNTVSLWIRSVISLTHESASEEDYRSVRSRHTKSGRLLFYFC